MKKVKRSIDPNDRANDELAHFRYRDLQRAVAGRGMPYDEIVNAGHPKLASWFLQNYERSQNENLIVEFDSYIENELIKRGYKKGDAMLHPSLRFSFTKGIESLPETKPVAPPPQQKPVDLSIPKEPHIKREKDESTGIMKGTKKAMTYDLVSKGESTKDIILAVKKAYPEAKEKSIKIWIKRAKDAAKDN